MKIDDLSKIAEKTSKVALYALILLIPISNAGTAICSGVLLLFLLVGKVFKPDFRPLFWSGFWMLALFVLFCSVSLVQSGPYIAKSMFALFLKWMKYILVFLSVPLVLNKKKDLNKVIACFLISSCVIAIDAFFQKCFGFDLLRHRPIVPVEFAGQSFHVLTATFKHYNGFAAYLITVLLMAIALLGSRPPLWSKRLFWLVCLLSAALISTYSRGAWLGLLGGLLLMMFLSRRYKAGLFLIFILAVAMYLCHGTTNRVMSVLLSRGDSSRFEYWQQTFLMIKAHPLMGQGIGTFMDRIHQQAPFLIPIYAHNCYLQIWAETGIFSLLAFVGFLLIVLIRAGNVYRESGDPILLGVICGLAGFLIHAFFDNHFYSVPLAFLFWVMLGILVAASRFKEVGAQ